MARTFSRPRRREGIGIGERLSESMAFILIGAALIAGGYWYFVIHMRSPENTINRYINAMNSGNVEAQYDLLATSTKNRFYPSKEAYDDKWPLSHGLSARVANNTIIKKSETPDRFDADVAMTLRKETSDLLATGTDSVTDHYVLKKQPDGWKIVLEASSIKSQSFANKKSSY